MNGFPRTIGHRRALCRIADGPEALAALDARRKAAGRHRGDRGVLESVLARDPDHPGANHYYIHAIEASPNAQKGQASAERLKTLVPGAGHLVHMPAHIFIRTGDYRGAIDANANAAKADEAYFGKTSPGGMYPMMYYTHNFQFLSAAAGMVGAIEPGNRFCGEGGVRRCANDRS